MSFLHKYDSWVRVISSGRVLGDQENLLLLNSCLPESSQKEIQLWEREKSQRPTYVEFRAQLEAKCGRAQSENLRKFAVKSESDEAISLSRFST